jgi:NTP pyrophosphatase (non-canonical NTP hydrolase)
MSENINELAANQHADSVRWFPSVHQPVTLTARQHAVQHFAFGVAGEVGEVVNKVKKFVGYGDQSNDYSEEWLIEELSGEIPDCIVYLLDLAAELGINLEQAMRDKRGICMRRWEPGYTWGSVPLGHEVPGSGAIFAKEPHAGGWHVTFHRTAPYEAKWTTWHRDDGLVPVALTSKGLLYPHRKNVS